MDGSYEQAKAIGTQLESVTSPTYALRDAEVFFEKFLKNYLTYAKKFFFTKMETISPTFQRRFRKNMFQLKKKLPEKK